MPSLVTLLLFVFELSSKNHRGWGQNDLPPPGRRISKDLIDLFLENQNDKKTSYINISITDLRQNQTKSMKQNMKHDLSCYRFAFRGKGQ